MGKSIFSKQAQETLEWINDFLEWVLPFGIAGFITDKTSEL